MAGFNKENLSNFGLFTLRATAGIQIAWLHGWEKFHHYSDHVGSFPDPLNMGHRNSLLLAVAAELVGGILLSVGLLGRLAALLLSFNLFLVVFKLQAATPWRQREAMVLYLAASLAILFLGSGRWALDAVVWKRFRGKGGGSAPAKK